MERLDVAKGKTCLNHTCEGCLADANPDELLLHQYYLPGI